MTPSEKAKQAYGNAVQLVFKRRTGSNRYRYWLKRMSRWSSRDRKLADMKNLETAVVNLEMTQY